MRSGVGSDGMPDEVVVAAAAWAAIAGDFGWSGKGVDEVVDGWDGQRTREQHNSYFAAWPRPASPSRELPD